MYFLWCVPFVACMSVLGLGPGVVSSPPSGPDCDRCLSHSFAVGRCCIGVFILRPLSSGIFPVAARLNACTSFRSFCYRAVCISSANRACHFLRSLLFPVWHAFLAFLIFTSCFQWLHMHGTFPCMLSSQGCFLFFFRIVLCSSYSAFFFIVSYGCPFLRSCWFYINFFVCFHYCFVYFPPMLRAYSDPLGFFYIFQHFPFLHLFLHFF